MNTKTVVALILIVVGLVVLVSSGIAFTTPGRPIEFLGLSFETRASHFIPPVVGVFAFIGGLVLLLAKRKRLE